MTWGDVRDWVALIVVAAAICFTGIKVRERRSQSRRRQFLARFKATREGRRFHEDWDDLPKTADTDPHVPPHLDPQRNPPPKP